MSIRFWGVEDGRHMRKKAASGAGNDVVVFVGDNDLFVVLDGVVVVVGEEVFDVTLGDRVEGEIEPDEIGAVGVEHLVDLALPLIDKRLIAHGALLVWLTV